VLSRPSYEGGVDGRVSEWCNLGNPQCLGLMGRKSSGLSQKANMCNDDIINARRFVQNILYKNATPHTPTTMQSVRHNTQDTTHIVTNPHRALPRPRGRSYASSSDLPHHHYHHRRRAQPTDPRRDSHQASPCYTVFHIPHTQVSVSHFHFHETSTVRRTSYSHPNTACGFFPCLSNPHCRFRDVIEPRV